MPGPLLVADDVGTLLAALAATALCVRAGLRQEGRTRLCWLLFAAATALWSVGEAAWAFYDLVLQRDIPVPSWADIGYLGAVPFAVAALIIHPAMHTGRVRRARSLIDGLVIATSLAFLSWTFLLEPVWNDSDLTTAGGIVSVAYPFSDVVIVFFIVLVARRMAGEDRRALWWLLAGLLLMALSDSVYTYLTAVRSYEPGNALDVGWIAAYLAIAVSALAARPRHAVAAPAPPPPDTLARIVAPFLPLLAAMTAIGVKAQLGEELDTASVVIAFGLLTLVLVRQGLLFYDLAVSGEGEGNIVMRLHAALVRTLPESGAE